MSEALQTPPTIEAEATLGQIEAKLRFGSLLAELGCSQLLTSPIEEVVAIPIEIPVIEPSPIQPPVRETVVPPARSVHREAVVSRPVTDKDKIDVFIDTDVPPSWRDDARCAEVDPELFFPEKGGTSLHAKRVCGKCDVKVECLSYAIDNDERFGIWGGQSERERRRIKGGAAIVYVSPQPYSRVLQLVDYLHADGDSDKQAIEDALSEDPTRLREFVQATIHWFMTNTDKPIAIKSRDNLLQYFTGVPISAIDPTKIAETRISKDITKFVAFIDKADDVEDPLGYCWEKSQQPSRQAAETA